jgi:hypothetical protein
VTWLESSRFQGKQQRIILAYADKCRVATPPQIPKRGQQAKAVRSMLKLIFGVVLEIPSYGTNATTERTAMLLLTKIERSLGKGIIPSPIQFGIVQTDSMNT